MPRNIAFVIWMLGYAFLMEFSTWNPHYYDSSLNERGITGLIAIVIWVVVGKLLYEKKP